MKKLAFLFLIPYVSFAGGFVKYTGEGQFNTSKPEILKNHRQYHSFDIRYDFNKDIYVAGKTDLFLNNIYVYGELKTKRIGINTVGIKSIVQIAGKNGSEYNNTVGRNAGDITLVIKDYFPINGIYNVADVYYKSHFLIYPKEIGAQIYTKIDKIKNITFEIKANAFYEFENSFDELYVKTKVQDQAKKNIKDIEEAKKVLDNKGKYAQEIKKLAINDNDIKKLIDEWKTKLSQYTGTDKQNYEKFLEDTKDIRNELAKKLPTGLEKYKNNEQFLIQASRDLLYATYKNDKGKIKNAISENNIRKLNQFDQNDFINKKSSYGAGLDIKMTYRPIESLSIIPGLKMKVKNVNYYGKSNLVEVKGSEFTYSVEPNITIKHIARVKSFVFENLAYFAYEYNGTSHFKIIPESSVKYEFLRNFTLKVSAKAIVNNLKVSSFNLSGQMEYKW